MTTTFNPLSSLSMLMDNKFAAAAIVGSGVWMLVSSVKPFIMYNPDGTLKIELASPESMGAAAAALVLAYKSGVLDDFTGGPDGRVTMNAAFDDVLPPNTFDA